jgi:hypothetical protein
MMPLSCSTLKMTDNLSAAQADSLRYIAYNRIARKWGRQASTGAVTIVAMHAELALCSSLSKKQGNTIANSNELALAA